MKPINRSNLKDLILAVVAWKGVKRGASGLGRAAGVNRVKNHRGTHLEDQTCSLDRGGSCCGGPGIICMKGKLKLSHKQCKNRTIQRMAFKGTITFFQLKNTGIKNFTDKKVLWSSPLTKAVKARYKGIKKTFGYWHIFICVKRRRI
jgi:hypothetical protein